MHWRLFPSAAGKVFHKAAPTCLVSRVVRPGGCARGGGGVPEAGGQALAKQHLASHQRTKITHNYVQLAILNINGGERKNVSIQQLICVIFSN